jgi:endonuclease/exonuclease/phosphatase family metal-dependent hydrolase
MRIFSWNVRSFESAVNLGGNAFEIIRQVVNDCDVIAFYEVKNSANGNAACASLNAALVGYAYFTEPTLGLDNEDDQVAVFWNTNTANVVNTTAARRPNGFGGRQPVYFNLTDTAAATTQEVCAWHAPEPTRMAAFIAQDWNRITNNAEANDHTPLTGLVMGDFNAVLTVGRRGRGRNLIRQIATGAPNGTTLRPGQQGWALASTAGYRSGNTYDQFYAEATLIQPIGPVGVYDVMNKLVNNQAPFTGLFGTMYSTPKKAYTFYLSALSDHLTVGITVNIL